MSENETEDPEENDNTEPVAEADPDDAEDAIDDDDDVEGHMFGSALKPGGIFGNTASTPDFQKAIRGDLTANTVSAGAGIPQPGEVSRPTRNQ